MRPVDFETQLKETSLHKAGVAAANRPGPLSGQWLTAGCPSSLKSPSQIHVKKVHHIRIAAGQRPMAKLNAQLMDTLTWQRAASLPDRMARERKASCISGSKETSWDCLPSTLLASRCF
jgi:hypothetical protein